MEEMSSYYEKGKKNMRSRFVFDEESLDEVLGFTGGHAVPDVVIKVIVKVQNGGQGCYVRTTPSVAVNFLKTDRRCPDPFHFKTDFSLQARPYS